jgi:hypothetical protein
MMHTYMNVCFVTIVNTTSFSNYLGAIMKGYARAGQQERRAHATSKCEWRFFPIVSDPVKLP